MLRSPIRENNFLKVTTYVSSLPGMRSIYKEKLLYSSWVRLAVYILILCFSTLGQQHTSKRIIANGAQSNNQHYNKTTSLRLSSSGSSCSNLVYSYYSSSVRSVHEDQSLPLVLPLLQQNSSKSKQNSNNIQTSRLLVERLILLEKRLLVAGITTTLILFFLSQYFHYYQSHRGNCHGANAEKIKWNITITDDSSDFTFTTTTTNVDSSSSHETSRRNYYYYCNTEKKALRIE